MVAKRGGSSQIHNHRGAVIIIIIITKFKGLWEPVISHNFQKINDKKKKKKKNIDVA
jgi:hypothetical protein